MNKNKSFVFNIMSIALIIFSVAMLPSLALSLKYKDYHVCFAMITIIAICLTLGCLGHKLLNNELENVKMKYCYMTTAISWVFIILLSALPYYVCTQDYSLIDCIFESTASWTTTGASSIPHSVLPVGLKLWRSTCNWLGGIGIILLTLSFIPNWQFVGHKLASTEIRGPEFLMSTMTFRKAYQRIILFYVAITLVQFISLRAAGMSTLPATLTALSNTSTSGLQHFDNGIILGLSTPIKIIITFFAFIGATNIGVFITLIAGKGARIKKNSEFNLFIILILVSTILITTSIVITEKIYNIPSVFGNVLMQIISFVSTAGYIVTPCGNWSTFAMSIVIILMFIGACAMSTGGGLKITRAAFSIKSLSITIFTHLHPHSTKNIKYNGIPAKQENVRASNMYVAIFLITYLAGSILITLDGTDVYTAMCYSQAMLTNVGTSMAELAEPGLVADVSSLSKIVMSFLMLLGRLEIYPILMVFSRRFWSFKS